ncbi:MAG: hypothetical protein ACT4O9_07330 [Blastocatellia bacterium]
MKLIFAAILFLSTVVVGAQIRTFRWNSEMCEFSGTYDSKRYTETQLRNTAKLFTFGEFNITNYVSVWKYEEIEKLNPAALDNEYKEKSAALKTLDIIKTPYWEAVRRAQLKELDQVYNFNRTKLTAFKNPAVLRDYPAAPSCKAKYAEAIITGGDSLLKVWLDVNVDSRKRNADPERLRWKFEEEKASPDRLKYALVEVMGFGWGNCANAFIERDEAASDGRHLAQFKKLFRRVREECEEP